MDKDFIKKQALQLLVAGCENFNFYGSAESIWHFIVDEVDILLNPDSTSEAVVLTSGWNSINDFVDALVREISVRAFVPHDIYLIYDDEKIFRDVLQRLNSMTK